MPLLRLNRLLTPDLIVRHVSDASPALLAGRGIRAVITDLDNTIVAWHSEEVTEEVGAWLLGLRERGISVCIASNTRNFSRLKRLAYHLGIECVPGNAGKPGTGGLRRALTLLSSSPEDTAMVGDQLFTDVVAGNRLGLFTVLVNPLTGREFVGTRLISRSAERIVLRGERARK
ncbi:MAG TPA: YqeG family HAD IIIA-type phosphatase [Armatimonadaceae bacterium]|nr:YqeG family HAD IIIA-type phosphatase [Armatimonadaceae bacterium]